ncbi:MAG TPA: metallophosphoesterase [Puia sp.]|nr:metallophosphoesterase [Puia sp.]
MRKWLISLFLPLRRFLPTPLLLPLLLPCLAAAQGASPIQIVFTSDVHFGINRRAFGGDSNVRSADVNARLVAAINRLPNLRLPADGGVSAGDTVGPIGFVMISGDIANREENGIQSASDSWEEFRRDWLEGITLRDQRNTPAAFLLVPGNHDLSDAVGFYRPMKPATDPASMVGIYNLMMRPAVPLTAKDFRFPADKVNYSRNIGGICFLFITIWPDSGNRVWMEKELSRQSPATPVVIVAHDPPEGDAAHFVNPNGKHDINPHDRFENLLEERYKDPAVSTGEDGKPNGDRIEQLGFAAFLKAHPNIRAYFHGHNNWNEFYTYRGPDDDLSLPVFRADSPMKGKESGKDERRLSFQLISIDPATRRLTARECRWDPDPSHPGAAPVWGGSRTLQL